LSIAERISDSVNALSLPQPSTRVKPSLTSDTTLDRSGSLARSSDVSSSPMIWSAE
jgi:hypothetical protein